MFTQLRENSANAATGEKFERTLSGRFNFPDERLNARPRGNARRNENFESSRPKRNGVVLKMSPRDVITRLIRF